MIHLVLAIRYEISGVYAIETVTETVTRTSTDCSHQKIEGHKFCPECGKKIGLFVETKTSGTKLREGFTKNMSRPHAYQYIHKHPVDGGVIYQTQRLTDPTSYRLYDYLIIQEYGSYIDSCDMEDATKTLSQIGICGDTEGVFMVSE